MKAACVGPEPSLILDLKGVAEPPCHCSHWASGPMFAAITSTLEWDRGSLASTPTFTSGWNHNGGSCSTSADLHVGRFLDPERGRVRICSFAHTRFELIGPGTVPLVLGLNSAASLVPILQIPLRFLLGHFLSAHYWSPGLAAPSASRAAKGTASLRMP